MRRLLRGQLRFLRRVSVRKHLVIASRGSALALWQANYVKSCLEELDPTLTASIKIIKTRGDKITDVPLAQVGGKGLFVKEIEDALLDGRADLAVHSMKDVPMRLPDGLIIGCMPKREAATDCYLSRKYSSFEALPEGARVGTSSLRRKTQLLYRRPDLEIVNLRGNVDTRLNKLRDGQYDAIVLATAGLFRLELSERFALPFDTDTILPAAGQGAIGIECLEDNYDLLVLFSHLEDRATRVCVDAERAFLARLDGSCQVPIAAHARMLDEENILLQGLVADLDGSVILRDQKSGDASEAERIGENLADQLIAGGAATILEKINS